MDRLTSKKVTAERRAHRVRTIIRQTSDMPRLSVHVSNKHVLAQIIDDKTGKTLVYVSSTGKKVTGSLADKAVWVGNELAAKAKKAKLTKVVFDRGARKYHGRIKALADAARQGGMEF